MSNQLARPAIAVVGGTGKEGTGLAYRLSKAGYPVIIGSRQPEKAVAAAREIELRRGPGAPLSGASNLDAAAAADIVLLTVPYQAHIHILESIRPAMSGKLMIDATVPLQPGQVSRVHMPPAGSAAQETRQTLGEGIPIAAAFHTISHEHLLKDEPIECDVLVTGSSPEARAQALEIVAAIGLQGWDAGPLENSAVSEGLTSLLIHINKKYRSRKAGIVITGVRRP